MCVVTYQGCADRNLLQGHGFYRGRGGSFSIALLASAKLYSK